MSFDSVHLQVISDTYIMQLDVFSSPTLQFVIIILVSSGVLHFFSVKIGPASLKPREVH